MQNLRVRATQTYKQCHPDANGQEQASETHRTSPPSPIMDSLRPSPSPMDIHEGPFQIPLAAYYEGSVVMPSYSTQDSSAAWGESNRFP